MNRNLYIQILFLIFLLVACYLLPVTQPVLAEVMQSDKLRFEITKLDIKSSDKPANAPQPPKGFSKNGYMVSSLPPDTKISLPFSSFPGALLVRAKPGSQFSLPLTIYNFKDSAVLKTELVPFTLNYVSLDCSIVNVAMCQALDWLSIGKSQFHIKAGSQKKVSLKAKIPKNAPEGDYYIKLKLSNFKKPYLYTSTDIYLTITKDGIIQQNISFNKISINRIVIAKKTAPLRITVTNGSPYFEVAKPNIAIKSPLGFTKKIQTDPVILLSNQSRAIEAKLDKLPWGPVKITVGGKRGKLSKWIFFLGF